MIPYRAKKDVHVDESTIGKGLGSHYPGDDNSYNREWFTPYTIPAGSMVIPTFWFALHDPAVYPQPDEFKPERFMTDHVHETGARADGRNYMVFGCGMYTSTISR